MTTTTTTEQQLKAATAIVIELAKAVTLYWKENHMPMPLGPAYTAFMTAGISLDKFNAFCSVLSRNGFDLTTETICPGKKMQEIIAAND